jgi:hypothetical protein
MSLVGPQGPAAPGFSSRLAKKVFHTYPISSFKLIHGQVLRDACCNTNDPEDPEMCLKGKLSHLWENL